VNSRVVTPRWATDTRARISSACSAKQPDALRAKRSNLYRHDTASLLFDSHCQSNSRCVTSSSLWGVWLLTDLPSQTGNARWLGGKMEGKWSAKCSRLVGPFHYFSPDNKHLTLPRENTSFVLMSTFFKTKQRGWMETVSKFSAITIFRDSSGLLHKDENTLY